jgi:type III secretion system chaperone SycN
MNWLHETIEQFGLQLGLPSLSLGAHGVAQLELQAGGLLAIEPAPGPAGDVLVYLGRPLGFDAGTALRSALARAHFGNAPPIPVQVGVRGEGPDALLLALVRVPQREFTLPHLNRVVEFLGHWMDGARHV